MQELETVLQMLWNLFQQCIGQGFGEDFRAFWTLAIFSCVTMLSHMYTEIAERLEDDNDRMRSVTLCKVCQTSEVNVVFLPGGHLVAGAQVSFFLSFPQKCLTWSHWLFSTFWEMQRSRLALVLVMAGLWGYFFRWGWGKKLWTGRRVV